MRFEQYQRNYDDPIKAKRKFANELYNQQQYQKAKPYFEAVIADQEEVLSTKLAKDYINYITCLQALNDHCLAVMLCEQGLQRFPKNITLRKQYALSLHQTNAFEKAQAVYLSLHKEQPDQVGPIEMLSELAGILEKPEEAREYGRQALELKHNQAMADCNIERLQRWLSSMSERKPIPIFNPNTSEHNVIAFSLWGSERAYTQSAIINAQMIPHIYPGWSARFYCDNTVPSWVLDEIIEAGATVFLMPENDNFSGLFWRFSVANDPRVDRFLIRDCDSVISCQERLAVDQWLTSDSYFHVLHNWCSHCELIMAGLWGGVAGVLPDLQQLAEKFCEAELVERTVDQRFLRLCVWPLIQDSVLIHDNHFSFHQAVDYPDQGAYPKGHLWHIGCSWYHGSVKQGLKRYDYNVNGLVKTKQVICMLGPDLYACENVTKSLTDNVSSIMLQSGCQRSQWLESLTTKYCLHASPLMVFSDLKQQFDLLRTLKVPVYLIRIMNDPISIACQLLEGGYCSHKQIWLPKNYSPLADPSSYLQHGVMGDALWLANEFIYRSEMLCKLFAEDAGVTIISVAANDICSLSESLPDALSKVSLPSSIQSINKKLQEKMILVHEMISKQFRV